MKCKICSSDYSCQNCGWSESNNEVVTVFLCDGPSNMVKGEIVSAFDRVWFCDAKASFVQRSHLNTSQKSLFFSKLDSWKWKYPRMTLRWLRCDQRCCQCCIVLFYGETSRELRFIVSNNISVPPLSIHRILSGEHMYNMYSCTTFLLQWYSGICLWLNNIP